jgi:hypothetical protein
LKVKKIKTFFKNSKIQKMGLHKGRTNNPEGKPPGALNKLSKDLRVSITDFLQDHFNEVITEWGKLKGKDKLQFYRELIQYSVPKMQAVAIESEFDKMTDEQLDRIIEELKQKQFGNEATGKN